MPKEILLWHEKNSNYYIPDSFRPDDRFVFKTTDMIKLMKIVSLLIFVTALSGCSDGYSDLIHKLEQIKKVGDDNPRLALNMLDSITIQVRDNSEYVQMKYELTKIRLSDKAYIKPSSDYMITDLLNYFVKKGNNLEKQEVFYYAGSIYRDLNDTPRALEYFHKSEELAEMNTECDSTMLKNTYSQIFSLMYSIQDYQKAYEYANKEYCIAKKTKRIDIYSLNHLGLSYFCLDSLTKAKLLFCKELDSLSKQKDLSKYTDHVYSLLYNFSLMKDKENSSVCFELSKKINGEGYYTDKYIALGEYYLLQGKADSAITCYDYRIKHDNSLTNKYDVSKCLFKIYLDRGDLENAIHYASIYVDTCDSLDLGIRQELAATINNQFQYHYDKEKEQRLKEEKDQLLYMVIIISVVAILGLSLLALLMIYRKNRNLKEMLRLTEYIDDMKTRQKKLKENIYEKENELRITHESYNRTKEELESAREKLRDVSNEMMKQKDELKAKEQELMDKIKQNRTFIKMIHQAELEDKAQEVVDSIKMASNGTKHMKTSDWKLLMRAVDELYPDFYNQLTERIERLTEQRMQVCYLMKIGIDKKRIQNITNISRVTIWRWYEHEFKWIIESTPAT